MSEKTHDRLFHVDDPIQVTIEGADEETPTIYFSRVEEMGPDGYLIEWPIRRGELAPIKDQDLLMLILNDHEGAYGVEARVLARVQRRIPLLRVRPSGSARKIQKRKHLRVSTSINVELAAHVTDATIAGNQPVSPIFIVTDTVTLSGGGFSIHYWGDIPVGALYDVRLAIPTQQEPLEVKAQVVRSEPLETSSRGRYNIGFVFVDLTEDVQCGITGFLIQLQQMSLVRY